MGGSRPTGVHIPKESSMMDTSTQRRRNWLLFIMFFSLRSTWLTDEAFQRMAAWLGTEIGIDASQFISP